MRRIFIAAFLTAAGGTLLATGITAAQAPCPAGRTAGGECVNAALAGAMQQTAIILSQPKISETAYPVLPSGDAQHRYPNQLNPNPAKPALTTGPTP